MGARNPIDHAFERIALLKAIVASERARAEADPFNDRLSKLGIVDPDAPKSRDVARGAIADKFNDLALLLDHLTILHMAAAFEYAAGARIGNALGVARGAIDKARKAGDRWPSKLLRDAENYESLRSIEDLLSLPDSDMEAMKVIRRVRNALGHGVPITGVPAITAEDARAVLVEALAFLRV